MRTNLKIYFIMGPINYELNSNNPREDLPGRLRLTLGKRIGILFIFWYSSQFVDE